MQTKVTINATLWFFIRRKDFSFSRFFFFFAFCELKENFKSFSNQRSVISFGFFVCRYYSFISFMFDKYLRHKKQSRFFELGLGFQRFSAIARPLKVFLSSCNFLILTKKGWFQIDFYNFILKRYPLSIFDIGFKLLYVLLTTKNIKLFMPNFFQQFSFLSPSPTFSFSLWYSC